MAGFLNAAIHVGPAVFALGIIVAIACFAIELFGSQRSRVLRGVLVTIGIGIVAFWVGTAIGIGVFCFAGSAGNLCGLGGVFGTGPFVSGICIGGYAVRAFNVRRGEE